MIANQNVNIPGAAQEHCPVDGTVAATSDSVSEDRTVTLTARGETQVTLARLRRQLADLEPIERRELLEQFALSALA
jgi:hypothetical protein